MRKKSRHHQEEGAGHERWLVSYADFITLMFAFFTVLYATSERNVEKTQEFQESLKRYLIKAGGSGGADNAGSLPQNEKGNQIIETPLPTYKSSRPQDVEVTEVTERQVEEALTKKDRESHIIDLFSDEIGVRIVVRGASLFPEGESGFKKDALPFLDRLAGLFKRIDRRVFLEGHVDKKFIDDKLTDFNLAQGRVFQVARYLSKIHNFSSDKLSIASFGGHRPLSSGVSNLNDRLEFVVLYEDSPL